MDNKEIQKLSQNLPVDTASVIKGILDAYNHGKDVEKDIAEINAKKECVIEDIKQRYGLYNQIFAGIFNERDKVISKNFEIIEKGITENNDNLISMGLNELSKVVTSSPFMAFADFQQQLKSGQQFEL